MKHKASITSRLLSFRSKRRQKPSTCRRQNVAMECLGRDQHIHGARLTVGVLRENVHQALVELLRLMRNSTGRYLNLETDDVTGAELNQPLDRNCAFLWAAYTGDTAFARRLHELGVDVAFAHPLLNFNALHLASLRGSADTVRWLLRQGCPIVHTCTGLSPMHFAAHGDSLSVCRILQEHGCDVDGTVLHAAAYAGAVDCANFVLGAVTSPNEYDENGHTALHVAVDLGDQRMLKLLLNDPRIIVDAKSRQHQFTPLHLAAENGYADCVQALLDHGALINATNARGRSALHLCSKHAYIDCVKVLLERGADVNVQDAERRTALHAAVSKSPWSLHIVRMLVERDANVNVADEFGYTCLHNAALHELDECVEYLIMQGSSVAARTRGNVSALNIINRKTPISVKAIPRRLDLALAYKEQNLKLNFRDLLRQSQVGESSYLHSLQKEGQCETLEHPLCRAFLHLKWQKVRSYIIIRVVLSIFTALLLSFYVLVCITDHCDNAIRFQEKRDEFEAKGYDFSVYNATLANNTGSKDFVRCNETTLGQLVIAYPLVRDMARDLIFGILFLNGIRIGFSLAAYRSASKYFAKYLNILELYVTCSVIVLAFDPDDDDDDRFDFKLPVAASAVLCCWTYLMITIGQLPFFGTYIAMFNKVLHEFIKMITAFFCLLVGFTFTFCVLKPESFRNPVTGFVRVVGMMTGELNIEELTKLSMPTYVIEYTLLAVLWLFMILVTIVLMNLLVGIAVNDVEGLRKTADLSELIQQTKLIYFIEQVCFEGYFPHRAMKLLRQILYIWPDSYTVMLSVRPLNPHEKRIPKDIMDAAVEIAVQRTQARYKKNAKTVTVEKRLESLEGQLISLEETIATLSRNLMRLAGDEQDEEQETQPMDNENEDTK